MQVHSESVALLLTIVLGMSGALFVHLCLSVCWKLSKVMQAVCGLTTLFVLMWPLFQNRFALLESFYLRFYGRGPGISQVMRQIHDTLSDGKLLVAALDAPENAEIRECLKSTDPVCPLVPGSFIVGPPRQTKGVWGSVLSGTMRVPQRYTVTGVPCWDPERVRCSTAAFPVAIFSAFSSSNGSLFVGFCGYIVKEGSLPKMKKSTRSAGCLAFDRRSETERHINVKGVPGVYGFTIEAGRLVRAGQE